MDRRLTESNHHFSEYDYGDLYDILSGIINTASRIIAERQQNDPYFKQYSYCIINGGGSKDIKIPDYLKDQTSEVEKVKKFLWWTTKRWKETIVEKHVLEIQSPYLMNYEIQSSWLSEIGEITVIVPIFDKYNATIYTHKSKEGSYEYFSSADFTDAYGWVCRGSSTMTDDGKLIASILMLNLCDYGYDSEKHKILMSDFAKNWKSKDINGTDGNMMETISHEFMHLYDVYNMFRTHGITSSSSHLKRLDAMNYKDKVKLDTSKGDKTFIEKINSILYHFQDTEMNAFNSGSYATYEKFIEDNFDKHIVSSGDANTIAIDIKNQSIYKYVNELLNTSYSDFVSKIGKENAAAVFANKAYNLNRGKTPVEKFNMIKSYYKARAISDYRKKINMLAEVIQNHNKQLKPNMEKVNEVYGYPAVMGPSQNTGSLNLMGYQYQLLPMNDFFQQKKNKNPGYFQYVHRGTKIRAYTLGSDSHQVEGYVSKIEKNESGEIIKVYILNAEGKIVQINPETITTMNYYSKQKKC